MQTTLSVRLPDALGEIPDKWTVSPISYSLCFVLHCKCKCRCKCTCLSAYTYYILISSVVFADSSLRAINRSLKTLGTRSPPSGNYHPMCSSVPVWYTTMVSAMPLQHPLRQLSWASWLASLPMPPNCAAPTNKMNPATSQIGCSDSDSDSDSDACSLSTRLQDIITGRDWPCLYRMSQITCTLYGNYRNAQKVIVPFLQNSPPIMYGLV